MIRMQDLMVPFVTVLIFSFHTSVSGCETGEVQLVSGGSYYGAVQVCIAGTWGRVCRYGWDNNDANVVCRQLGYESGTASYEYSSHSDPIFLDYVGCDGTEQNILDCDHYGNIGDYYSSGCNYRTAEVTCQYPSCTGGSVRLSEGMEGYVETCYSGRWYGVCTHSWDFKDAFVVCRELGYPATAAVSYTSNVFGRHLQETYLYSVLCFGNESSLLNCQNSSPGSTCSSNRAAVRCAGEIAGFCGNDGTVRLADGEDSNEGRVEICSNGVWGTVYDSGWDSREGEVICRQLGYQNPNVYIYDNLEFGEGTGPVLFRSLDCDGSEASLYDCSGSHYSAVGYNHYGDAGLRCEQNTNFESCVNYAVRLVGGEDDKEGRVEICYNSVWGSVCDYGWDIYDARVVCRQLGLDSDTVQVYYSAYFGEGLGPFHLSYVSCSSSTSLSSLSSCSTGYGTFLSSLVIPRESATEEATSNRGR